jgi:hypothetical protein
LDIFYRVFELPLPRNAQKREKKKSRKNRFWIFGRTFCKNFSTRLFLQKDFYGVLELRLPRNAPKRTKKKSQEKKSQMVGGWV